MVAPSLAAAETPAPADAPELEAGQHLAKDEAAMLKIEAKNGLDNYCLKSSFIAQTKVQLEELRMLYAARLSDKLPASDLGTLEASIAMVNNMLQSVEAWGSSWVQ